MKAAVKLVIFSVFTVVSVAFLAINVSSGSENIERAEKIVEYAESDVVKTEKELAVAWAECLHIGAEVQCSQEDAPGGEGQAAYQKHQEYADQYVAEKQINANREVDATFKDCITEVGYEYCRTEVCDHRDKPERNYCVGKMIKAYDALYAEAYNEDGLN